MDDSNKDANDQGMLGRTWRSLRKIAAEDIAPVRQATTAYVAIEGGRRTVRAISRKLDARATRKLARAGVEAAAEIITDEATAPVREQATGIVRRLTAAGGRTIGSR